MAFALFLVAIGERCDGYVLLGRVQPGAPDGHVPLPPGARFAALPWWEDLSRPLGLARALPGTLARFWRELGAVDTVLLFGPSPLGLLMALLAKTRGRRIVVGVRMSYPDYVRARHPDRRALHLAAGALEHAWRALARRTRSIAVGAQLARRYDGLPVHVSLVRERDVSPPERALGRGYDGSPLTVVSVGRIEAEKNPLLLAEVLRLLRAADPRWRLVVCGDGPMSEALAARLEELGLSEHADLRGFVAPDELRAAYEEAHALLHVSLTEGAPQVLLEAFAAGTPVVATDVGGVAGLAGPDAALLVPPDDARAAASALERIAHEPDTRERLVRAGLERARAHTLEAESERVARFVEAVAA